mmetsp:Transcript_10711/g.10765  ORF Transcript_10711/g.10765 Transcript_10711/m.10765 type:complete len:137 (+) Transcript_10711:185-595(+)
MINILRRSSIRMISDAVQSPTLKGCVEIKIDTKLKLSLNPMHLEIFNESSKHNVPPGSESHFKILVVSDMFEGKSLIQRHRLVNTILAEELQNDIHALSIQAKTPSQWDINRSITGTPKCMGGDAERERGKGRGTV